MSQIILIENDEKLRSILKLNIMKCIGCNVIEKDSAIEALSLLEIVPNIDMIICREKVKLEKSGHRVADFLENGNSKIPLLVIGSKVSNYKHLTTIDSDQSWKTIVSATGSLLGVEVNLADNRHSEEFVPVGIHFFLNISSTSMGCDVYIRVKKGDDYQFIKRLHSTDNFNREDIEKYKSAGLTEFYISKEHFPSFVNFVTSELTQKLESKNLTGGERVKVTSESFEVTIERIQSLGIDEHTVEIVEESINSMKASLGENNALSSFLQSLRANSLSYAYSHSYLSCLILHKIVTSFDWQSAQVKEKLTFISYFHDISLKENLMKLYTEAFVAESSLSREDKNTVLNHANLSAAIVDKFPNVPQGIGSIIKEHHGSKNGIGFPESLSIALNPISMMFIVVENFVDEFLKIDGNPDSEDLDRIFNMLEAKYTKLTYVQTVVALRSMIHSKKKPVS